MAIRLIVLVLCWISHLALLFFHEKNIILLFQEWNQNIHHRASQLLPKSENIIKPTLPTNYYSLSFIKLNLFKIVPIIIIHITYTMMGALAMNTTILVTNQVEVLPTADKILVRAYSIFYALNQKIHFMKFHGFLQANIYSGVLNVAAYFIYLHRSWKVEKSSKLGAMSKY